MRSAFTRQFVRHYGEMVLVMFVGMAILALPAQWATGAIWPDIDASDPTLMLGRMGVTMTLPMVPWMRWRGHRWQPTLEMAAAMAGPAIGVVVLLESGVAEGVGALMAVEHVVMLIAMFAVMVARPQEYLHADRPGHALGAAS